MHLRNHSLLLAVHGIFSDLQKSTIFLFGIIVVIFKFLLLSLLLQSITSGSLIIGIADFPYNLFEPILA